MPSYEAELAKFEGYDAQVLGISIDTTHSNGAWSKSMGNLSYPLLCDWHPKGEIAERYGVLREQGMAERALFVIDKAGKVAFIDVHELLDVPDNEDLYEVLATLK